MKHYTAFTLVVTLLLLSTYALGNPLPVSASFLQLDNLCGWRRRLQHQQMLNHIRYGHRMARGQSPPAAAEGQSFVSDFLGR
jgi:hypothetical protein